MNEFKLLIPQLRNDNRAPHSAETIREFESRLLSIAGGFTIGSPVVGKWKDDSGKVVADASTPVYITLAGPLVAQELAQQACELFAQQCVYLRAPDGSVTLVPHADPDSVAYREPSALITPADILAGN